MPIGPALLRLGWLLLPTLALLAVLPVAADGAAGRYQAALAALIGLSLVGAFGTTTGRRSIVRVVGAAAAVGAALSLVLGSGSGALAGAFLGLAVGTAAGGLAAVGRRLGLRRVPAGAVAVLVVWTAMAGLTWADPVAQTLPRPRRRAFRQAVLHVDPALALAYDGVGYDRMRAPDVYFDVPLASSYYDRPAASTTGATWLALGLLAAAASWRRRRPPAVA